VFDEKDLLFSGGSSNGATIPSSRSVNADANSESQTRMAAFQPLALPNSAKAKSAPA
jgi:hypothetical protein